ncbi:hypothetical protein [Paenibacillus riograndensis]|uniref:Uncharacterized protein n=1 Tax=Paenibacillus riograndensis SBR5 TaxID=1073571 RepID=A0A0E4HC78_9BACL|nr:hypothetical protein [Paenibacillus riograndensis]CQR56540.1 hypothetical protein PRIO_4138 [Paenibacillus riograndensis SBR5]
MIYALGYRKFSLEHGHEFIIQKHITKDEYDSHNIALGEASKISAMDNVHNLLNRNGNEFLLYSSGAKDYQGADEKVAYLEANRLLINYLAAVSMFIDYGEKYNSKYFGKERMKKFQEKTSVFYDNHISYRFIVLMRNYVLHFGFPLSVIHQSESGTNGFFASRETLLKFKAWKHATEDIKKMSELISLDIHIEISMMFIKQLYQDYIYEIAPTVLKGIEYLNNMIKNTGGKMPILVTFKSVEEFKKGNLSANIIDAQSFYEALEIIKSHPSIDIIER